MSTQNSLLIVKEKVKDIFLDDKRMKADDIARAIIKRRKREDENPPGAFADKFEVCEIDVPGGKCFYITPKNAQPDKAFFYIHGGDYSAQIRKRQWDFVGTVVERTGYGAFVPIYPLTPEHSAEETFDMLTEAYKYMTKAWDFSRLVITGDSTGGGLALSMSIIAWEKGIRRPDKLVLISPALDTEFMDRNMENEISNHKKETYKYYYRPAIKDFLKKYWIKDLYHQNKYTSPLYADLTDICDEIAIFTVEDDLLNCYARALYDELKKQQIKIHYFEYFGIAHDYIEHPYVPECRMITNRICESIKDKANLANDSIRHAVWARSMVAERYPNIYEDDDSIKLAIKLGTSHKDINSQYSDYDRIVTMEKIVEMDKRVKQFINRYADGIIVNVGSELNTMFSRMDNGRIRWYNVDMPEIMELRRSMMETRDREQNIGKSILDFSWLDSIKKKPGQAMLFVCEDVTKYFTKKRLQAFLNAVWEKFPGSEVVFDIKNSAGKKRWNFNVLTGKKKGSFIKVSIDNCTSLMYDWNIKYKVMYDKAILNSEDITNMYSEKEAKKYRHAIRKKYDKIIQLKIGTERVIDSL